MIETMSKSFTDVFSKNDFNSEIKNTVKHIKVNKLQHVKGENLLRICGVSDFLLNENKINTALEEITNFYGNSLKIQLDLKYNMQEDFNEIFDDFIKNYIKSLKDTMPVCATILKKCVYTVDEEKGRIYFKGEDSKFFLLKHRNIDLNLKEILLNRFNKYFEIIFVNNDENKDKSFEKWDKKRKTENVRVVDYIEPVVVSNGLSEQGKFKRSKFKKLKHTDNLEVTGFIENSIILDEIIVIAGEVVTVETRDTKSGKKLIIFDVLDETSAVTVKTFTTPELYEERFKNMVKKGNGVIIGGKVIYDEFSNELSIMADEIDEFPIVRIPRFDERVDKRVELHCHTNMSDMDAIASVDDIFKRAKDFGHTAVAITDHGVVQAFPHAGDMAKKTGVKALYGVEGYIYDDLEIIAKNIKGQTLNSEFVVFDIETTSLYNRMGKIIEIAGIKVKDGKLLEEFQAFVDPLEPLSDITTELTNITDDMVKGQDTIEIVLPKFLEFIGNAILVAHNSSFDVNFINKFHKDIYNKDLDLTYIDTVTFSQCFVKGVKNYKLNTVADFFGVSLENHHRALDDTKACANIFLELLKFAEEQGLSNIEELNKYAQNNIEQKYLRASHIIVFAQNYVGLRNLYELVSKAHIEYFFRRPRFPKSVLSKFREGLILGTACEAGELYKAIFRHMPYNAYKGLLDYYDYYEVQPLGNNQFLIDKGECTKEDLIEVNKDIINYGEKLNKLVVATGDVHYLDKRDNIYRSIVLDALKMPDCDKYIPLYYRNTDEMLEEFYYLEEKKAYEIVVTNTNKVADMLEDILPVPNGTFPPLMPKADEDLTKIVYDKAFKVYGDPLPKIVKDRIERELGSIIKNGFSVMYIIAQKLVWKSLEDGYLVGSRGSVGSSFVATMSDITEVNPLQPHYFCKNCQYTDFDSEVVQSYLGSSGCDMPDKECPKCGAMLSKDGHDIPFETFLGFDGDKEPDIDLNFSGEYQARAHAYTEELFGEGFVFKAGTIGTLADKTAYAYVSKYFEKREKKTRNAEINFIKDKLVGIRKSSGQHPGGLMVVPSDNSIYNFCPVQRPANDMKSNVITTHFDYHSISGRLLKLDILGHDVPTILRRLEDLTGVDPRTIDIGDKSLMKLFLSPEPMGVTCEEIACNTGSLGLPEFGTNFVRKMLLDTKPDTFAELVRISGLSHGTDVWLNNGQDLVQSGTATLKEIIPTRDDIMVYLILQGVEDLTAFIIMESVRKGKGLSQEQEEIMVANNVPRWYIDSCKKIKYMFPKGHAVAYVMMSVRIAFYKLYHPAAFYAATLSEKYSDIDYSTMCVAKESVFALLNSLNALKDVSQTEKNKITALELIYEMLARGIKFTPIDIYKAECTRFIIVDGQLMPPLCTISGLGENAGETLVNARIEGEFKTLEDFRNRTKISKTVIQVMIDTEVLKGIPETNQVSLFEL
ncbi:MAG: PolC-type DNA polymerase III [Lachnospirales bacterium]